MCRQDASLDIILLIIHDAQCMWEIRVEGYETLYNILVMPCSHTFWTLW